jgi:hypothetical protein
MARRRVAIGFVLATVAVAGAARAVSTPFTLLFDGTEVGGFSVDPALASPVGLSDVNLDAFDLSTDVSGFGLVSFTLADVTGGSPLRAVFLDGALASLTSAGATGTLPGGEGFFLDLAPFVPADASLIDLSMAGQYNLQVALAPEFPDKLGSFGIAPAGEPGPQIPEPGAWMAFGLGIAWIALGRGRAGRRR